MNNFKILISESARDFFYSLEEKWQNRLKKSFRSLKENPFKKRSGADIKKLKGSFNPAIYRMRVGDYRIIYVILEKEIKITSIIQRGKGYKWLD